MPQAVLECVLCKRLLPRPFCEAINKHSVHRSFSRSRLSPTHQLSPGVCLCSPARSSSTNSQAQAASWLFKYILPSKVQWAVSCTRSHLSRPTDASFVLSWLIARLRKDPAICPFSALSMHLLRKSRACTQLRSQLPTSQMPQAKSTASASCASTAYHACSIPRANHAECFATSVKRAWHMTCGTARHTPACIPWHSQPTLSCHCAPLPAP